MRILLASDHYPPFIGGAHRQAQLLAKGMAELGHEVTVVTPWHGGLPRVDDDDGIPVYRVRQIRTALPALVRSPRQRHQPPFPDPVTILDLRRVIAATRPGIRGAGTPAAGWWRTACGRCGAGSTSPGR